MQKKVLLLLSVSGLLFVRHPVLANDIEPSKEFYTVIYTPQSIALNGVLDEWSGVPVLADPKFAVPKYSGTNASPNYVLFEQYAGGTWTGPDDQTSAVQIVYDTDNVYFGFVVTDDYHENISGNAWNGDSIQIMIADAARTNIVALYNYALAGYEDNQGTLVPDPNLTDQIIVNHQTLPNGNPSPGGDPACNCPTEAVIKRDFTRKKTTYEIKMPKAALGITAPLKAGPQFGLGMAINDGDGALVNGVQYGQAGQEGQKGWGGLGAHSIVFGKTPQETALITLAKGNDIEPGKEYYTALRTTNTINLDGTLSEWSGAPVLADPKFAVPKYSGTNPSPNYVLFEQYAGGTWSGPDDQTSAVQIVYDADNVYFGFVVTDDYHENVSRNAWNGDSIQLMIADAARTNIVALYNYALGGYENATGTLVDTDSTGVSYGGVMVDHENLPNGNPSPGGDPTCNCPTTAFIKRDFANKKTTYEIKLPVASLGLTGPLGVGTQFGLGMAINDGDGALVDAVQYGQAGQEGQKGWGGLGAHSIVFGKTPQQTALVTLGTTVSGSDLLFLSAINPSFDSFTFRATDKGASIVNPSGARLIIDGQTNTPTASPKVVDATDFTYRPASPFPPNSDHVYVIQVKDTLGSTVTAQGTFKTDNYSLDKLHSYYAQIRSGSALTPDKGGHTGQAGDSALDFGAGAVLTAALIPDASFINAPASNNAITISAWIKKYDNTANSSAFWAESASAPGYRGVQANVPDPTTGDEFVAFDVGGNTDGDSRLSAAITGFPGFTGADWWTNWHHFVFIHTNDIKRIWIDGQLFVEGPAFTPLPTDFTRIWLGAAGGGQGGAVANMHGLIDDFAIFGTALTQAQVGQLFSGTLPSALPASTRPLAYWDFNAPAVVVRPRLIVGRTGNAVTISWPASATGFRLRSATVVTGPYSDVQGVTGNSYTINNPTSTVFYLLQQN